ncbi:MAG: hypothetical protein LQ349_002533 [Xanthoria aureola]|nr:MAG: hypothetical protein LQ349_002533 [Xanthoria aureola]
MHAFPLLLLLLISPTLTIATTLNVHPLFPQPRFPFSSNPPTQFDSLPTPHGIAPLPSPYKNLTFQRASVFNPLSPSLHNIITPEDHNCAVSAPNALIGSRDTEGGPGLTFSVADNGTFALQRLWVKPMNFPEGGNVTVRIFGSRGDATPGTAVERDGDEGLVKWQVEFPVGYHLPFLVKMEEHSQDDWTGLRRVQVVADYGEQKLDWEVCLDDLVVEFESGEEEEGGRGMGRMEGQVVLADAK